LDPGHGAAVRVYRISEPAGPLRLDSLLVGAPRPSRAGVFVCRSGGVHGKRREEGDNGKQAILGRNFHFGLPDLIQYKRKRHPLEFRGQSYRMSRYGSQYPHENGCRPIRGINNLRPIFGRGYATPIIQPLAFGSFVARSRNPFHRVPSSGNREQLPASRSCAKLVPWNATVS